MKFWKTEVTCSLCANLRFWAFGCCLVSHLILWIQFVHTLGTSCICTHSISYTLSAGTHLWFPRGDQKKMTSWRDLKSFCHEYLHGKTYYISCQKRLLKIRHSFEGSILDVDLGLFESNHQFMFSFVTFWFC